METRPFAAKPDPYAHPGQAYVSSLIRYAREACLEVRASPCTSLEARLYVSPALLKTDGQTDLFRPQADSGGPPSPNQARPGKLLHYL
jgi:hypothetical protein